MDFRNFTQNKYGEVHVIFHLRKFYRPACFPRNSKSIEGRAQSKFPTRPTASKPFYCMKQLHVRDRAMTLHDACTSGTSRVLTVASLQRLKMEALIPEYRRFRCVCNGYWSFDT